jgi:hypothetical protein
MDVAKRPDIALIMPADHNGHKFPLIDVPSSGPTKLAIASMTEWKIDI